MRMATEALNWMKLWKNLWMNAWMEGWKVYCFLRLLTFLWGIRSAKRRKGEESVFFSFIYFFLQKLHQYKTLHQYFLSFICTVGVWRQRDFASRWDEWEMLCGQQTSLLNPPFLLRHHFFLFFFCVRLNKNSEAAEGRNRRVFSTKSFTHIRHTRLALLCSYQML